MTDEDQVRALLEQDRQAWETQDVDALIRLNDGAGFGRRARDARPALRSLPELRKALQAAFEAFDYARVVDIDGDVQVDGDTRSCGDFFARSSSARAETLRPSACASRGWRASATASGRTSGDIETSRHSTDAPGTETSIWGMTTPTAVTGTRKGNHGHPICLPRPGGPSSRDTPTTCIYWCAVAPQERSEPLSSRSRNGSAFSSRRSLSCGARQPSRMVSDVAGRHGRTTSARCARLTLRTLRTTPRSRRSGSSGRCTSTTVRQARTDPPRPSSSAAEGALATGHSPVRLG